MAQAPPESEAWKRSVLRALPKPAWLSEHAPQGDIVLSSRCRLMRNLVGYRFPHHADVAELRRAMHAVLEAAHRSGIDFEAYKNLTNAERDFLVGCRLVSPDFEWTMPGRALLVDESRSLSLMVNEEDHLRVQALTAGWSLDAADRLARGCANALRPHLDFAWSPKFGYLSASAFNLGEGRRHSAMFHLIGLAHTRRLPSVIRALAAKGMAVRGLFGEASRAVGAIVQVSAVQGTRAEFIGACEYLIREERLARSGVPHAVLCERAAQAREYAIGSRTISLSDALRVLAWARFAASAGVAGFGTSSRRIDQAITMLEIRQAGREEEASVQRAQFLRSFLESLE
jgi:protein arginine kinase